MEHSDFTDIDNGREYWRTSDGTVYGYVENGKIFLTPEGFNSTTLVHEYTHLWARAMMQANPEAWDSVKDLLRDTPLWNVVRNDMNYQNIHNNEDLLCSEVLARYSGRNNAAKIRNVLLKENDSDENKISFLNRIRQGIGKFWSWVGQDLFHIQKFDNVHDITDRILYDLVNGTKLDINRQQFINASNDLLKGENVNVSDIDGGVLSLHAVNLIKDLTGVDIVNRELKISQKNLASVVDQHFNDMNSNRISLKSGDMGMLVSNLVYPDKIAVVDNGLSYNLFFVRNNVKDSDYVVEFLLDKDGNLSFQDYFKTQTSFENELSYRHENADNIVWSESRLPLMFVQGNDILELSRDLVSEQEQKTTFSFLDFYKDIINDISNGREPFSSKPGDVSEITVDRNADNSFLITNAVDYVQDDFGRMRTVSYKKPVTVGDLVQRSVNPNNNDLESYKKYFFVSAEKQMEARLMSLADSGMSYVAKDVLDDLKKLKIRVADFNGSQKQNIFFTENEIVVNKDITNAEFAKQFFRELELRFEAVENRICRELINHLHDKCKIVVAMAPDEKVDLLKKLNLPSKALHEEFVRTSKQKCYLRKPLLKVDKAELIMADKNFIGRKGFCYDFDNQDRILINTYVKKKIDGVSVMPKDWYGRGITKSEFLSSVRDAVVLFLKRGVKEDFFVNADNVLKFNNTLVSEFVKNFLYKEKYIDFKRKQQNGEIPKKEKMSKSRPVTEDIGTRSTAAHSRMVNISSSDDKYGLSNCVERKFTINLKKCGLDLDKDYQFNNVEQAFQSIKLLVSGGRREINQKVWNDVKNARTGEMCARAAQFVDFSAKGLELWNKHQDQILQTLIYCSFEQNESHMIKLFETGERAFSQIGQKDIKDSTYQNKKFPEILQKVRFKLKEKYPATYRLAQKKLNIQNSDKNINQKI